MKQIKNTATVLLAFMVLLAFVLPSTVLAEPFFKLYVNTIDLTVKNVPTFQSGLGLNTSGSEWYVNSNASGTAAGTSWTDACLTIDACINLATASNGDLINIDYTHAESYDGANGFDLDKAGLTLIFHRSGQNQATLTFTDTDATVACGAANNTIYGGRFLAGISDIVIGVAIEAACDNFTMVEPVFPEPTMATFEFLTAIDLEALADGVQIHSPVQRTFGQANYFIEMGAGVNEDFVLTNPDLDGQYAISAVWSNAVDLRVMIAGGTITNTINGEHALEFTAAATGSIQNFVALTDVITTSVNPGSMSIKNVCWDDDAVADSVCAPVVVGEAGPASIGDIDDTVTSSIHGKIGTDSEMGDASIWDMLEGDGFVSWPTGAKPANAVSLAEGLRYLVELLANGTPATIVAPGTNQTILDIIGTDGTTTTGAVAGSVLGAIGTDEVAASTAFASTNVQTDRDGSALERLEFVNKYLETGTPGGLIAPADTRSILDILGSDGTTTTAALAGSLLGAIGTNEAAADTPFSSVTVEGDVDGSALERLEALALQSDGILARLRMTGISIGNVYYVDDATGDIGDNGTSWALAKALIVQGYDLTVDDKGDIVFVAPDYEEALAAAQITLDEAGVMIIGLGTGEQQPMITMSDATSSIDVTAQDVTIDNIRFHSTSADNNITIDVDASGFVLRNSLFTGNAAGHVIGIDIATSLADIVIEDNRVYDLDTDSDAWFHNVGGVSTNTIIRNNRIWGDYDLGGIYSTQADVDLLIVDNTIRNVNTGIYAVQLTSTATGYILRNELYSDVPGAILDPGSMLVYDNIIGDSDLLDANGRGMMEDGWYYATTTFELDGAANTDPVFTVTGIVEVKVFGEVTETLTSNADTFAVGIVDSTVLLIAATAGDAPMSDGDIWTTATIAKGASAPSTFVIDTDNITVIQSGTNLADGTVVIHVYWRPLSAGASVVPI